MSDRTYQFGVVMACGGCSGAVTRVLNKLDGVKSFKVSLEGQSVEVTAAATLEYETVLNAIGKTGKTIKNGAEIIDGKKVEKTTVLHTP